MQGNALDLWAAIHRLPLYDAALHLAETFGSHGTEKRNPSKEPVDLSCHPVQRRLSAKP